MDTKLLEIPKIDTSLIYPGDWIDPDHFIYKERIYERCLDGTVVFICESKDVREKGGDIPLLLKKV